MSLGQRIAYLRQERSLTLQDVADGAKLTPSFLSRLERDQANISVANLRKLAQFFGVPMTYFFADEEARPEAIVVRADARVRLSRPGDTAQISALTPPGSRVEARLLEAQPGAAASNAARLIFVLCGQLRCQVGAESYVLGAGDTLLVQRDAPGDWECVGSERAMVVLVSATGELA
jgi:HTH-type transcriptional repressor of puuD